MYNNVKTKIEEAIWIGNALFNRNKVSGSSANISFKHEGEVYISGTNTCFGRLKESDFAIVSIDGEHVGGAKPSKELRMHLMMYNNNPNINAVIHVHSFYATLWSCLEHENVFDIIPNYTPYLKMKLGQITLIEYGKPGSEELFEHFKNRLNEGNGYILKNHGPVVGGTDLLSAFYSLEELEESAKVAWHLKDNKNN